MKKLSVGSCFSGIGGIERGLESTGGFETKWQIENDEYASRVLEKQWPNVKRYRDIRDVVRHEPVDLICGGFPCQDVSLAGARKGLEGKRSTLWSEMFRLVCEVKPRWIVVENVPGLLSSDNGRFFGNILRDLASAGYDAEWGVLSAFGVGAPHLRRRVFLLANSSSGGSGSRRAELKGQQRSIASVGTSPQMANATSRKSRITPERERREDFGGGSEEVDLADTAKSQLYVSGERDGRKGRSSIGSSAGGWWSVEPHVGRVAHGVPNRVQRLKCLGNSVVPQVAQKIGEMILAWEENY